MYHNMNVKFRIQPKTTVAEIIKRLERKFAIELDDHDLCVHACAKDGWIEISRNEVPDSKAGAAAALKAAVEIALYHSDPSFPLHLFDRAEEDGDNDGRNILISRNREVLTRHGYQLFLAEADALIQKLRNLSKHIEQAVEFSDDLGVEMLVVNTNNFENHEL